MGLDQIRTTFKANQLLTGHGNLKSYIKRFNLDQTDGKCLCGMDEDETQEHVMLRCSRDDRASARNEIRQKYGDLNIIIRHNGLVIEEQLNKINEWADKVMDLEEWQPLEEQEED